MTSIATADVIIVSDLHIAHPEDERADALLQLILQSIGSQVRFFILLGDVFEFCFPVQDFHRKQFHRIGEALTALSRSGIRVLFFEGNHEFALEKLAWPGVEIVSEGSRTFHIPAVGHVIFSHGDTVHASPAYLRFRAFVKSRWLRNLARWIPARILNAYALWQAKKSRSLDEYRTLDHSALLANMSDWLGSHAFGVFGHFHCPYYQKAPGREGYLLSVECWDRPNCVVFSEGKVLRGFWERRRWDFTLAAKTEY